MSSVATFTLNNKFVRVIDPNDQYADHLRCLGFIKIADLPAYERHHPCDWWPESIRSLSLSEMLYLLALEENSLQGWAKSEWVKSEGAICLVKDTIVCVFVSQNFKSKHLLEAAEFEKIDENTWKRCLDTYKYRGFSIERICQLLIDEKKSDPVKTIKDELKNSNVTAVTPTVTISVQSDDKPPKPEFSILENIIWVNSTDNTHRLLQAGFKQVWKMNGLWFKHIPDNIDQEKLKQITFDELIKYAEEDQWINNVLKIDPNAIFMNDYFLWTSSDEAYVLADNATERDMFTAFGFTPLEERPEIYTKKYSFQVTKEILTSLKDKENIERLVALDRMETSKKAVNDTSVAAYLVNLREEIETSRKAIEYVTEQYQEIINKRKDIMKFLN